MQLLSKNIKSYAICFHLIAAVTFSLLLTPEVTFAEEAQANDELEVIVVTAQRREQDTQDVPMSLSVLGESVLEKLSADSLQEYSIGLPNVSFFGSSESQRIGIRGVAPTDAGSPTVAMYLDDTPIVTSATEDSRALVDPRLFDIARIEVLRGPQGSLYGSSTLGGLIKLVTNEPDSSGFAGRFDVSGSTTSSADENLELNGMVNIPLVEDTLALRVVASHRRLSGFIDKLPSGIDGRFTPLTAAASGPSAEQLAQIERNINDIESSSIRSALLWTPNDKLSIQARVWIQDSKDDSRPLTRPNIVTTGAPLAPLFTPLSGERQTSKFIEEPSESTFYNFSLEVDYDMGFGTVTSATTYMKIDRYEEADLSRLNTFFGDSAFEVDIIDTEVKNFSQELRFQSNFDGPFQVLLGAFYADREETIIQRDRSFAAPEFGLPLGLIPIISGGALGDNDPPFFGCFLCLDAFRTNDEIGVFGNLTYNITDRLVLEAGLRWYDFKITGRTENVISLDASFTFDPQFRLDEDGVIPTASLSYHITDKTMVFGRVAKGFRPGSLALLRIVNRPACAADLQALGIDPNAISNPLDSDTLWNYEGGIKSTLFDNRLIVNAVGFYIDWDDRPESVLLACGEFARTNAGKARNIGFDLDFQARLRDDFQLSGGVGYVDAQFRTAEAGSGISVGDPIFDVPEWTYNIAGEYSFEAFNGVPGYVRAAWRHIDDRITSSGTVLEGFGVLSLRAGLEFNDWQIAIFAENATDENGRTFSRTTTLSFPPLGASAAYQTDAVIRPRTVGINIQRSF